MNNKIQKIFIVETIFLLIFFCISCFSIYNVRKAHKIENKLNSCLNTNAGLETAKESLIIENNDLREQNNILNEENTKLKEENETLKKNILINSYRLTSFWNNDECNTGSCTGSGLCEKDFQTNENGWYTYQGKLVLGTATRYLLKYGYEEVPGIKYYKYYDTLTLTINGKDYDAIVLDSCGACMKKNIIDLFVSNSKSSITTNITVK